MKINIRHLIQWIATLAVYISMTDMGLYMGWSSPNVARLTADNSPIPVTSSEASWIVSFIALGAFIGVIAAPVLIELVGSKKTVFATSIITSISWMCLIAANSVPWLYAFRIMGGMNCGMILCCFPMYLAEVSVPAIRGTMISIASCGAAVGLTIGTIMETYLHMKISSSIYLAHCVIGIFLLMWLPDSPYHLVKINNLDAAKKSISTYYSECSVEEKLKEIQDFVDADAEQGIKYKFNQLKYPSMRKSMLIIIILFAFPQLCGALVIISYTETILINAQCYLVEPKQFVIYNNIVSAIISLLAVRLIDQFGRRFLLIMSSIGTTATLIALGTHFYLLQLNFEPKDLEWIPLVSILIYGITYTVAAVPVTSAVLSEIFPQNMKSLASCLANMSAALFGFMVTTSYQPMVDLVGESYVFWAYAFLSFLAIPFALFMLPETKGKSFQEIQHYLTRK